MLHGCAAELGTDLLEKCVAVAPYVAHYADLDQLVRFQCDVDLVQYSAGQAVRADRHHRMKMMGVGAKYATFGGSEARHRSSVTRWFAHPMRPTIEQPAS